MAVTEILRKQHAELVETVRQIEASLDPQHLTAGAGEMRRLLSTLIGKLKMHLAMEDNALYPSMQKHVDAAMRDAGAKFSSEMAAIKPVVEAFSKKWSEAEIAKNAAAFCAETKQIFAVLADRIKRENTQLYPLVEKTT